MSASLERANVSDPLVCESCHQSIYQVTFGKDLGILCYPCHEKNQKQPSMLTDSKFSMEN